MYKFKNLPLGPYCFVRQPGTDLFKRIERPAARVAAYDSARPCGQRGRGSTR